MTEIMQAFFFGTSFGEKADGRPVGLAGYAIPDLGIIFRSRHFGSIYECQYAGFLGLLKFIETNNKFLRQYQFEILSDSALIVYQVAHRKFISAELAPYYNLAIDYKGKVDFKISWVPRHENIAITGLCETPPLKPDLALKLDINTADGNSSSERLSM